MARKNLFSQIIDICIIVLVISSVIVAVRNFNIISKIKVEKEVQNTLQVGNLLPSIPCIEDSGTDSLLLGGGSGNTYIILFGACVSCFKEVSQWNPVYLASKERNRGNDIIGIFVDGRDRYRKFTDRMKVEFPVYFCTEDDLRDRLRVRRVTQVYVAENDTIRGVYFNPLSDIDNRKDLLRRLQLSERDLQSRIFDRDD